MQRRLRVQENAAHLAHSYDKEEGELLSCELVRRHSVMLGCPGCEVKLYGVTAEQAEPFKPGQHFWLSLSPDGEPVV